MTIVKSFEEGRLGLTIKNKLGKPNELGEIINGVSDYGDALRFAGIYQSRPRKTGRIIVRCKHYYPKREPNPAREAAEGRLRAGVAAWQAMTEEEKNQWRARAKNLPYSGYNLFIKRALESV